MILIFIFEEKKYLFENEFQYKWSINYNNNIIGTMSLILRPEESLIFCPKDFVYESSYSASAIAYFYHEEMSNITKYDINQIEKDFISLANNRLLDVDEAYSNLYVIEKVCDDTLNQFRFIK